MNTHATTSGLVTLDYLAAYHRIKVNRIKHKAVLGEGTIAGEKVLVVKPQTFMNLSGESLREIVQYYKIPNENLIVIYDDVSLDVGRIRIRPKGSDGGHNGIKSIIYQLGSDVFPRIKLGIGQPPEQVGTWSIGSSENLPTGTSRYCQNRWNWSRRRLFRS